MDLSFEDIDSSHVSYFLATSVAALYVAWWMMAMFQRKKLPPGPARLPIVGSLMFHGTTAPSFMKLKEKYGDIFTLFIGNVPLIILASKRMFKEALDTKGNDFSGRGHGWLTLSFTDKKGGFSGSDYTPRFRETRSRALTIMHNLGFGRPLMERRIRRELNALVQDFTKKSQNDFNPFKVIMISKFNILYSLLVGERLSYDSKRAVELTDSIENTFDNNVGVLEIWSFMRFLPHIAKEAKHVMSQYEISKQDMREKIQEHIKSHSPGQTTDFLHAYIDKYINANADTFDADIENLHQLIIDILLDGTELSGRAIQWMTILLANNPDVQTRAHEEIDRVIGKDRDICMNDRKDLNYIQALIMEALRIRPLLPHGLPHYAERENTLGGYAIPKGIQLLTIAPCVNMDADIWGDPNVFRPERFLDESGHYADHPQFVPFSCGKRPCFGEALARQVLFLYTATILQKFQISPPRGLNKVNEEGHYGFTLLPKPTEFCMTLR